MSYGNYNDPVRYTPPQAPPPRQVNYTPWIIGCGSCVVLIAVLIGFAVFSLKTAFEEMAPDVPEAGMKSGTQLAWRELDYSPGNLFIVGEYMRTLDADGDGRQELLFYNSHDGDAELVDLEGNVLSHYVWEEYLENEDIDFWDCDGDGRDDVLVFDWGEGTPHTRCLDLDFNELHRFDNWRLPSQRASADFDGDGDGELLLISQDEDRFAVFNQGPTQLQAMDNPPTSEGYFSCPVLWADMDGDGSFSVLYGQGLDRHLLDSGGKRSGYAVVQNDLLEYGYDFNLALDVTGDGITDLLNQDDEYYNGATGEVVVLRNPVGTSSYEYTRRRAIVSFDHDADGVREICHVPDNEYGTELVIYAPEGNVEYHESMGKFCAGMAVIEHNGTQYLFVCAFDRLLVYP